MGNVIKDMMDYQREKEKAMDRLIQDSVRRKAKRKARLKRWRNILVSMAFAVVAGAIVAWLVGCAPVRVCEWRDALMMDQTGTLYRVSKQICRNAEESI